MPNVMTVSQAINTDPGDPIPCIKGKITDVQKPITGIAQSGISKGKEYRFEKFCLVGADGAKIKVSLNNRDELDPKLVGEEVYIMAHQSERGFSGVTLKLEEYKIKKGDRAGEAVKELVIEVTKTAEIVRSDSAPVSEEPVTDDDGDLGPQPEPQEELRQMKQAKVSEGPHAGQQRPTMAVALRPNMAVGSSLTLQELHERLEFVRQVMRQEMKEGQDYGKIPGMGDKPGLFQPGAQKLLMTFNLREQVKKEVLRELPHPSVPGHREYEFVVSVFPSGQTMENGWDGVGTCSTMESKYRYRRATRKCPKCGAEAIIEEKAEFCRDREPGWVCWKKKGGCGEQFYKAHPAIVSQNLGDVENEDPADVWNTARKIAFKRALVAAAINATNTSELWTQDVEDMVENKGRQREQVKTQSAKPADTKAAPAQPNEKLTRMIIELDKLGLRDLGNEYFQKCGLLKQGQKMESLNPAVVPRSKRHFELLAEAITEFGNGAEAKLPW